MSSVAISIQQLGKRYRLGTYVGFGNRSTTFREVLGGASRTALTALRRRANQPAASSEFWALREVSFDVLQGQVTGIVGGNGAGKSTLLKILSRITDPTEGRAVIRGRIASLLEVGTGFHPDLTGRENVYLNGTILGMTRAEVRSRFDDIVAFGEVERFLDTPVKRYSSGMYVRLAFAVAAHLEPEILIVDEVLAVGDQEFQAKCLGKMDQVKKSGRTVLFVSHNMAAVKALCDTTALLEGGRLLDMGATDRVLRRYLTKTSQGAAVIEPVPPRADQPYLQRIRLATPRLSYGDELALELDVWSPASATVGLDIRIQDENGTPVAYLSTHMTPGRVEIAAGRTTHLRVIAGPLSLAVGGYDVFVTLMKPSIEDLHEVPDALRFEVVHADPGKTGFEFRQSFGLGSYSAPLRVEVDER